MLYRSIPAADNYDSSALQASYGYSAVAPGTTSSVNLMTPGIIERGSNIQMIATMDESRVRFP